MTDLELWICAFQLIGDMGQGALAFLTQQVLDSVSMCHNDDAGLWLDITRRAVTLLDPHDPLQ